MSINSGINLDELSADLVEFDNSGSGMMSTDVEAAIKEAYDNASGVSKGFVFCQYNGNAGSGRFLEFFSGIDSDTAPLNTTVDLEIVEIVAATTATNTTCTIGFYNNTTLLYTVTFTAQKQRIVSGTPLFTLPASGNLKIKIDTGSITKPHLYFIAVGA